jgi:uncharacterized protein (DUF2062 family)
VSWTQQFKTKVIDPIWRAQGSAESVARGGAMGLWVALTPTVGIQTMIVLLLAVPLRANMPIAMAMCWITNPLTLIPFYFAFYWVGAVVLGHQVEGFTEVGDKIGDVIMGIPDQHSLVDGLLVLGNEILWPMILGSAILATVTAVPTYFAILRLYRGAAKRSEKGAAT